ncbi:hypothetical protein BC828DRAFT_389211 [Blastocladiella britannica]|nr:hypothetical protein BC828DRAFT_389211 [Blastocladiella britannica]
MDTSTPPKRPRVTIVTTRSDTFPPNASAATIVSPSSRPRTLLDLDPAAAALTASSDRLLLKLRSTTSPVPSPSSPSHRAAFLTRSDSASSSTMASDAHGHSHREEGDGYEMSHDRAPPRPTPAPAAIADTHPITLRTERRILGVPLTTASRGPSHLRRRRWTSPRVVVPVAAALHLFLSVIAAIDGWRVLVLVHRDADGGVTDSRSARAAAAAGTAALVCAVVAVVADLAVSASVGSRSFPLQLARRGASPRTVRAVFVAAAGFVAMAAVAQTVLVAGWNSWRTIAADDGGPVRFVGKPVVVVSVAKASLGLNVAAAVLGLITAIAAAWGVSRRWAALTEPAGHIQQQHQDGAKGSSPPLPA